MKPKGAKVYLSEEQNAELKAVVTRGKHAARKIRRANILLLLDENHGPVKTQLEIAERCHTTVFTVAKVAKDFCEQGMNCLERKKRAEPPVKPIVTGEVEAHILAINCGTPPEGHCRWTLSLTAERLVELKIVPAISRDTVGRALKKRIKAAPE
jgi:transposase